MKKNLEKGFFFAWGNNSFGKEQDLTKTIDVDLATNDGGGIALIAGKHFSLEELGSNILLQITNYSKLPVNIRIEKKFFNNKIATAFETINSREEKEILVPINKQEKKNIKELVVAILLEDNIDERKKYTISLKASI